MNPREEPLLFQKYPLNVPWLPLVDSPTPITQLENLGAAVGHPSLWMKRDEKAGTIFGGNKVRKLEFLLGEALQRKASKIVTFGAYGSNHALATTLYAKHFGFQVDLFLSPPNEHPDPQCLKNLLFASSLGANVRLTSYPYRFLREIIGIGMSKWRGLASQARAVYFIPTGGASTIGCLGFVNAALELEKQVAANVMPKPALIVLPVGSGGTWAGLQAGLALTQLQSQVIGVNVASVASRRSVQRLMKQTLALLSKAPNCERVRGVADARDVVMSYRGDGYAVPTIEGRRAKRLLWETERIVIEDTYTAKAMAAFLDLARTGRFDCRPLLFWNTCNGVNISR